MNSVKFFLLKIRGWIEINKIEWIIKYIHFQTEYDWYTRPDKNAVTYCGVVVIRVRATKVRMKAGMAHFIEHMLFKGTERRRSGHISRLEMWRWAQRFTSKEETVVYAAVLNRYFDGAIRLIADMSASSFGISQKKLIKKVKWLLLTKYNRTTIAFRSWFTMIWKIWFSNIILSDTIFLVLLPCSEQFKTADAVRFLCNV